MKYIVNIGYMPFVFDDEIGTATTFAEIAKAHAENPTAVYTEILTDEEYKERENHEID